MEGGSAIYITTDRFGRLGRDKQDIFDDIIIKNARSCSLNRLILEFRLRIISTACGKGGERAAGWLDTRFVCRIAIPYRF